MKPNTKDSTSVTSEFFPSLLFKSNEFFLENTFTNRLKQRLRIEEEEAQRVFKESVKKGLISQAKTVGFDKIPAYQTGPNNFAMTYKRPKTKSEKTF